MENQVLASTQKTTIFREQNPAGGNRRPKAGGSRRQPFWHEEPHSSTNGAILGAGGHPQTYGGVWGPTRLQHTKKLKELRLADSDKHSTKLRNGRVVLLSTTCRETVDT